MASSSSVQEAAAAPPASTQWRPKHYVLAGMAIILVASTVTIITSIILRPTPIQFSIANFTMSDAAKVTKVKEDNRLFFGFDLVAYNPSRRAGVIYRHVFVSMQLQKSGNPNVRKTSVPGNVADTLPLSQGTNHANMSMRINGFIDNDFFGFYLKSSSVSTTVMVIAQVQFKIGLVKTIRLYSIKVLCTSIGNLSQSMPSANATCFA